MKTQRDSTRRRELPSQELHRHGGMTLIELIIVSALLFILSAAVASMTMRGQDAQRYAERSLQLNGLSHDLIEMVRKDVSGSTRFLVHGILMGLFERGPC